MREIEVDGDTISEVVAYLNGHKTVPAKRMADAVLRLLNRHYQDAAALEAAREDAERWRHARKLLTIDDIEGAQGAYESFGRLVSEYECKRADDAIDQARGKGVADA